MMSFEINEDPNFLAALNSYSGPSKQVIGN